MRGNRPDRFVRLPTELLDALIHARLTGSQWRVLLWVLRYTYGWHRPWTLFTWYRIAQEICMDRPTVYRAGKTLLRANVLTCDGGRLAIQMDYGQWGNDHLEREPVGAGQLRIAAIDPLPGNNGSVACRQRNRCPETTHFRRVKESSKERLKTVVGARPVDNEHGERRVYEGTDQHPALGEQLMDHYIALNGKALTKRQTVAFYRRFGKSAKALLEACGGNVQEAKDAITRIESSIKN